MKTMFSGKVLSHNAVYHHLQQMEQVRQVEIQHTESITADKVADILDRFSFRIKKDTFLVLDNAKIHRCKLINELRPIWEKRGLFLFFLPPYSPHLNIAETLWRILKGKWLRPADYMYTESLLYDTNRALAALGTELYINFAHVA